MTIKRFFVFAVFCLLPCKVSGFSVIADLSPNRVEIHSKFTGKKILVFGAIMEKADNIIVIVHGPKKDIAVHKKIRIFGLWTNGAKVEIKMVPLFFSFSSSNQRYDEVDRVFHGEFTPFSHLLSSSREMSAFAESRVGESLYQFDNKIELINERLFRGNIFLPSNVPKGQYVVEVLALKENRIIGIEVMPLLIVKTGLDGRIFELSHSRPLFYALTAVIGALVIGWAGFILPRTARTLLKSKGEGSKLPS
ncbi:TIGR02186 family protein [Neorickettsia findlayensis]|uniref:TIGR02186 family protein n=1 Tax=Neorickettsia findlayensis TaxID=2686014 RepID=UPI001F231E70|nr:TIGR02186 family protein [Neorickettsia findlayensis]